MTIDILVVTPDREMRKVIREALDGLSVRITAEKDTAKQAYDAYRADPVDIVLCDLFLSGANGLDAVKTLKKSSEHLTFILLTRIRDRNTVDKAFRYGCSDVLIYPCGKDVIRETVKHRLAELHGHPGLHP